MGDRKSEAGSRVEAPQKSRHNPHLFLLQHSSAPDFWLLAPWLLLAGAPSGPRAIERKTQAKAWAKLSWPFGPSNRR